MKENCKTPTNEFENSLEKSIADILKDIPKDVEMFVDLSMLIAVRINNILKEKNITVSDFSKMVNKPKAKVQQWLAGVHNFKLKEIVIIQIALEEKIINVPN